MNSNKIQFGATIDLLDEEGKTKTFTIVGVDEVNTSLGRISWQSPVGKSLIGKSSGDEVLVKVPSGEVVYEVISVTYKPIE